VCDRGYTSAGTAQCGAYGEGTYKNATGNQACSACPADTVTVSPNVDPNDPAAPPAIALSGCICGPGFCGPVGGPCAVCEAGTLVQGWTDKMLLCLDLEVYATLLTAGIQQHAPSAVDGQCDQIMTLALSTLMGTVLFVYSYIIAKEGS